MAMYSILWKWAQEGEVSRILCTTFDLSLEVQGVNNSLSYKILKTPSDDQGNSLCQEKAHI